MRFKPLALQVLQQILLYAVLFWLLVSATRAGFMFYQGQRHLEQIPETVSSLYMPLLAQSVWNIDTSSTQKQLATISALPDVDAVLLDTRLGQHLRYDNRLNTHDRHKIFQLDVNLNRHNAESLGTLTLYVSTTHIRKEIVSDLLSNMAQRVLDFAALGLLIVFILRRRFVQPVQQLVRAVRAFKPGETLLPLRLQLPTGHHDEMTQLLESFNTMRANINSHQAERQRYETELTNTRDQLAHSVKGRTAELDHLLRFQTLISAISSRFINIPLADIDHAMNEALAQIGAFMQVDRCYLIGVDQSLVVSMVHEWAANGIKSGTDGLDFAPLASRPGLFASLMREGVLNLPHCQAQAQTETLLPGAEVQSVLQIRIDYLGSPVGVFGCDMVRCQRQWQSAELVQARLLGEMFANMIMRCQQLQKLSETQKKLQEANAHLARMALSDSLTGLANRRHFDEEKRQAFDKAKRNGDAFSLIFIDIDSFKEFNDHYGHQAGDDCLRRLAQVLVSIFSYPGELPARVGGEEFAILLPGMDQLAALKRAEQLRLAVWDLNIEHLYSRAAPRVTISLGAIGLDCTHHQSVDQMIAEADAALYRAKSAGRNCIG
jgi:diguanylate cyclase (GGDEF)-like protein